jgi:phosphohistidine swiveling domain-containing protein
VKLLVEGIGASAGRVSGKACVMRDALRPVGIGEILVTVLTDPLSFADLVENASALVTDLGGLASHPAILAREMGIPAVVGTGRATSVIPDGARILVDGTAGAVYELD